MAGIRIPLTNTSTNSGNYGTQTKADNVETFNFRTSQQFLGPRLLLRIMSLWCPRSSCFLERFVYPLLINICLLVVVFFYGRYLFYAVSVDSLALTVRDFGNFLVYLIISLGAYLNHCFGLIYFKSHDLEDNMTNLTLEGELLKTFRRRMIYFNIRLILSLSVLILFLLGTGFTVYGFDRGLGLVVVAIAHFHLAGMYLALLWVVDLLQVTSRTRLNEQYQKLQKWTLGVEEASNYHVENYSNKVKLSCYHLSWWFSIHNAFLIVTIPAFVFINRNFHPLSKKMFITAILAVVGIIAILLIVWALPLYLAAQIQKNDENFCCKVNELCTLLLRNSSNNDNPRQTRLNCTFEFRSNIYMMVSYLKNTKSGFNSVGYSFQLGLRLSQISTLLSLITFIFNLARN